MYEKAFREVNEVLENMDDKYTRKISPMFINTMIENIDWSYDFKLDLSKSLEEQISDDAKAIISVVYLKYFASKDEKIDFMKEYEQYENKEKEIIKQENNLEEVFNNRKNIDESAVTEVSLSKISEKWYEKVFEKIKRFFRKEEKNEK